MKAYEMAQKMSKKELVSWLGKEDAEGLIALGGDGFVLDPDVIYPATLFYLGKVSAGEIDLPSYIDPARQQAIRSITPEEWVNWAGSGRRDVLIDTARRIFTALLREQNGGQLALKIIKGSEKWRLSNPNVVGI